MTRIRLLVALTLTAIFQSAAAPAQTAWVPINHKPSGNIVNHRVDLNAASRADLMKLPGIDESIALAVIEGRPYKSTNELVSRKIVSAEAYEVMRARVTVAEK